jgi:predicted 3-demethylubiquinone-9 3-methyltransferase (glyoxalase superfamily)
MELTTFLWFDGRAREAATFYSTVFPDSTVNGGMVAAAETPSNEQGSEMIVNFTIMGRPFTALNGGPMYKFSEAISFQIPCTDQAEIDKYWDLLTANGGEAGQCGWLKDKFGISWQVVSPKMGEYLGGSDGEGAMRATQAMLAMKKIVLADLEGAYLGK